MNLPIQVYERSPFVERMRTTGLRFAEAAARALGCRPENILLVNEVSLDGLLFRPVLNAEMLNLLFIELEPGTIYRVGCLYLRRTAVVLSVNEGALKAPPALLR